MDEREQGNTTALGNGTGSPSGIPEPDPSFPAPDAQDRAPAPRESASPELSKIVLVQAGLTVFNGIMLLVFSVLWLFDLGLLFQILQRAAGLCLLLALAPTVLGGFILHGNKRLAQPAPGTIYATAGLWIGVIMSMMTLIVPTLVTFRALFENSAIPR